MDDRDRVKEIMKSPFIMVCTELRERMIENKLEEDYIIMEFSDVNFTLKVEAKEKDLKSYKEEFENA